MKKIIAAIILILTIFTLTACAPKTYDEISYKELKQMIENKEDFALMIGAESCSACTAYKPTLNKVIKNYKLDIKYIDLDKLSEDEYNDVISNFNISGTPTVVFATKGEEEDTHNRIVGNEKYSQTVEALTKNGYIKE